MGLHVSTRSPEMIGLRVIAAADKPGRMTQGCWRFCCLCPLDPFPAVYEEGESGLFGLQQGHQT